MFEDVFTLVVEFGFEENFDDLEMKVEIRRVVEKNTSYNILESSSNLN